MSQSLAKVYVHIICSTKNRTPWLKDSDLRSELFAYMATVLKNDVDSPALLINGVEDHVHVLCRLSRKFAIMDVLKAVKTEKLGSPRWGFVVFVSSPVPRVALDVRVAHISLHPGLK